MKSGDARVGEHQINKRARVHPHDAQIVESRAAASHGQHAGDGRREFDGDKVAFGKSGGALDDELALARADLDFDRQQSLNNKGFASRALK